MTLLVVLSAGPAAQVQALQADLGEPFALAVQGTWDDRWRHLNPFDDPDSALQQLQPSGRQPDPGPGPVLVGLPLDPGLPLARGGHWAEALGAWRQPVVVVFDAEQLQTGVPAAMTALLKGWQVPLVGLVQWGGPWEWAERRRDGLPWLGALQATHAAESSQLRSAVDLALRCRLS